MQRSRPKWAKGHDDETKTPALSSMKFRVIYSSTNKNIPTEKQTFRVKHEVH